MARVTRTNKLEGLIENTKDWILFCCILVIWELGGRFALPHFGAKAQLFFPIPSHIIYTCLGLLLDGTLLSHCCHSLWRVMVGVLAACFIGIPLGLATGLSKRFGGLFESLMRLVKPIPPVAWIPISILWFGVTDIQRYFIVFIGTTFVVFFGTVDGARRVPALLLRAAQNLGANRIQTTRHVLLRAALPDVFTCVREAFAFGWFIIVAAEFVSAPNGLGFLILEGRNVIEPERVFVGMLAIGLISCAFDRLLRRIQERTLKWQNV